MSSGPVATSPRRGLNERQAEVVERLLEACSALLDELGHDKVTIRLVADRASTSAATAYMFFSSKEHLFAELFWRHLQAEPAKLTGRTVQARLTQVATRIADLLAGAPELASAANRALLSHDPEVDRIRFDIGTLWMERFHEAIGPDADPDVLGTLLMTFSGILLMAGVGDATYSELPAVLERAITVILS